MSTDHRRPNLPPTVTPLDKFYTILFWALVALCGIAAYLTGNW